MLSALIFGLICINAIWASPVDYTGYKVIKFNIANNEQLQYLSKFQHIEKFIMDEHPMAVGLSTTIGIPPSYITMVTKNAARMGTKMEVIYDDLQVIIDLEKSTVNRRTNLDEFDFDAYHRYDSIVEQLNVWNDNCPSGLVCELYDYATTHEGRQLWMLKIGVPGGNQNAHWFHGATHAREWISPATLLKVMDRFWTGYGVEDDVTELINNYDWYFSPITNPDGYEYTHTDDRMWRKNRGPNEGSNCMGTDINRNYDSQWGTEGISHNPCDTEVYCGDGPASELETQGIQNEVSRIAQQQTLLSFVDMHAYGRMILMPYSYSIDGNGQNCARAPNHEELLQVSNAFADAIQETYGTNWSRGSPCDILYTVSGGSMDWGIEKGGVYYSFAPELRGAFFTANPDQIEPSSVEFFNGMMAMVAEIEAIEGI